MIPIIRKVFNPLNIEEFVSVQPMNLPSNLVFPLDFKCGIRVFDLFEELWLEDYKTEEYWCPQIREDSYISDHEFFEMRWRSLIFEDWEIKQIERYVDGLGNDKKPFVATKFKSMWFPET
jgi:hypothetical protein